MKLPVPGSAGTKARHSGKDGVNPMRRTKMGRWVADAAAVLAMMLAALPVQAAASFLTPDSTVEDMYTNPALVALGLETLEDGTLWPEQPWQNADSSLQDYLKAATPDSVAGLNLLIDNDNHGVQVSFPLYSEEEIAADPTRAEARLFYFPAEQPGGKYALVVSGNFLECTGRVGEGCGSAFQLHEMGYAAFVLQYRAGSRIKDNSNYQDLVRAVQFITQNAQELGVQPEDYALVGYSAGGQLCGLFGTDRMGYSNYGLPKPGALLLGYPIVDYMYSKPCYFYVYDGAVPGDHLAPGDYYYNIDLPAEISPRFPATYHWFGKNDLTIGILIPPLQGPLLDKALEKNGVMHQMTVYDNAPHGVGVGNGTDAEGWLKDAVAFWEAAVAAEQ